MRIASSGPDSGFSVIEVVVATGVLCTAAIALTTLFVASSDAIHAARHRTTAVLLAAARLETLVADPVVLRDGSEGQDVVDATGRLATGSDARYLRGWSVMPAAAFPTRLLIASVEVTPSAGRRLTVQPIRIVTFVERQP